MNRRATLACLLSMAFLPGGFAAAPKRVALFLRGNREDALRDFRGRLKSPLEAKGWIEGKTMHLDTHMVDGDESRYPEAARRLVATGPDVIWTNTWFLARALQSATSTIPIVAVAGDPVGAGLAKSLQQPGANVTGISLAFDLVARKQLEMLGQLLPNLKTIHGFASSEPFFASAVRDAGLALRASHSLAELDAGLAKEAQRDRAAVVVPIWVPGERYRNSGDGYGDAARVALRHRLPSIGWSSAYVDEGGLCSFTMGYDANHRARVAAVIDKMLRGGNPATTPFEMPTKSSFGINRTTAAAIGVEFPAEWMLRADHVV